MRLLSLHNDYIFKALFVRNPDILLDLINSLPERLLLYWSKTFSSGIQQGMEYSALPKAYSINFLNFLMISNTEFFHTTFQIIDTRTGKIALTEHLEITIT